ncbi:MAG: ribonuclease III [Actinomycetota bacterium]|nr:ribonuclease III [Actinomycetota bacterium]
MAKGRANVDLSNVGNDLPDLVVLLRSLIDSKAIDSKDFDVEDLKERLPHFAESLTHRSFTLENQGFPDNERLEFLGDSILAAYVSRRLFEQFPDFDEGRLTIGRANLVNTDVLAQLARSLNIGDYLVLGVGEEASGGRRKRTILAGAFEAVVATVYLDLGDDSAMEFVERCLLVNIDKIEVVESRLDPKSELQIHRARLGFPPPKYQISVSGPDHMPSFTAEIEIDGLVFIGSGASKKEAEQRAALEALSGLGVEVGSQQML